MYCSLTEETTHKKFWWASVLECGLSHTRPKEVLFRCRLSNISAIRMISHRHNLTSFLGRTLLLNFQFCHCSEKRRLRTDGLNDAVYYLQATKGPYPYRYSAFFMNNHNWIIHFTVTQEINKGRYYSQITPNYNQLLMFTKLQRYEHCEI